MRLKGYEIINNRGRYEVYYDEILICVAESYHKAEDEIEEHKSSKNPE